MGNLAGNQAVHNLGWKSLPRSNKGSNNATEINSIPMESVSFSFNPSMSLRKQNYTKFINKMKNSGDIQGATAMQALVAQTDIIQAFDNRMQSVGLSANNVADAYAVWWISAWGAVNQRDVGASSQIYNAVKQQAVSAMQNTSEFAAMNNSDKQTISEAMLVQAAIIDAFAEEAVSDSGKQAALAKAVNQGAKKMGLDLTTMDLTENGFVPRSGKRSDASDAVDSANPGEAGSALAANDPANDNATSSDTGKLALYGVGGVALLAGMFALGKSFGGKG